MGAFLAPIFVIIIVNVVFFVCVIVVVTRHAKDKAAQMKQSITNKEILCIMFGLSGVFSSLVSPGASSFSLSLFLVSEKHFKFSLQSSTHSKASLPLHLFYSQRDSATGSPFCHVQNTDSN